MTGRLHQLYFRVIRYSPPIDPRGNGIEMLNFFLIVSQLKTIRIGWFDANSHLSYRHRDIEEYVNVRSTHNIQISSHLQTLIHRDARTAIRTETGLHLPIDDPPSKIPRVMHVRLCGLAIQTWCHHSFYTKSARQGGSPDWLARLLITRQMALSPKSKRVIAAQHGMCSAILRVPLLEARIQSFGVKKPLGFVEMLLYLYVHVSFDLLLFLGWSNCGHAPFSARWGGIECDTSGTSGIRGAMFSFDNDGEYNLVMI